MRKGKPNVNIAIDDDERRNLPTGNPPEGDDARSLRALVADALRRVPPDERLGLLDRHGVFLARSMPAAGLDALRRLAFPPDCRPVRIVSAGPPEVGVARVDDARSLRALVADALRRVPPHKRLGLLRRHRVFLARSLPRAGLKEMRRLADGGKPDDAGMVFAQHQRHPHPKMENVF